MRTKRRGSRNIKKKSRKVIRKKRRSYINTAIKLLAVAGIGTGLAYLGKKMIQNTSTSTNKYNQLSEKFKLNYNSTNSTYIEVMPDVEGCWSKVVDFMSLSNIFTIDGKSPNANNLRPENFNDPDYNGLQMKRWTKFVCLGDTIDNGPNNIAILKLLKYLKEKFDTIASGCSVIFILGNRDINKLRFLYELGNKKARTDIERLLPKDVKVPEDYPNQNKVDRFKWIASKTMGASNILDFIKQELGIDNDEQAVDEYMKLLKPDGLISYYLRNGQMLHYDKWTKALFVHGGINCSNFRKRYMKIYEENDTSKIEYDSVLKWEKESNEMLSSVINSIYKTQTEESKDESKVEWFFRYMDEQISKKAARSVIISRPWKSLDSSSPEALETGIGTSIIEEGCFDEIVKEVKYIFNGHTPIGQIPVIMRTAHKNKELVFVFCDTTYAGRIGNIKLVKDGLGFNDYQVAIKAKYTNEQKTINDICGSKYTNFTELEYSTKDPIIGTKTQRNTYAIAKINGTEYLTGEWNLKKMNTRYPQYFLSVDYNTITI